MKQNSLLSYTLLYYIYLGQQKPLIVQQENGNGRLYYESQNQRIRGNSQCFQVQSFRHNYFLFSFYTIPGLKAEIGEERMEHRYGADYTFKDDILAGSKVCYQIEIKFISKERGQLNMPRLKVTSDSIHILGGLQTVLHFRKRFQV
ncbi:Hypothetical_protein [Hexamita inflata]|uniref:Hypothetical_protein n=1 Tax=Hexamita inflata TaxID=28002 RepID=A0AA86U7F2_9EUKA|nr:Hypothetical protein HINF_LOCUS33525 [Hexamita inflata]